MLTREQIKPELTLLFGDGDPWGSTMQIWFGIAAELHYRNPDLVPAEWRYRPSPIRPDDPREPDDFLFEPLAETETDALVYWGSVFNRYASRLRRAGKDY